jgi:hypothetical protein
MRSRPKPRTRPPTPHIRIHARHPHKLLHLLIIILPSFNIRSLHSFPIPHIHINIVLLDSWLLICLLLNPHIVWVWLFPCKSYQRFRHRKHLWRLPIPENNSWFCVGRGLRLARFVSDWLGDLVDIWLRRIGEFGKRGCLHAGRLLEWVLMGDWFSQVRRMVLDQGGRSGWLFHSHLWFNFFDSKT